MSRTRKTTPASAARQARRQAEELGKRMADCVSAVGRTRRRKPRQLQLCLGGMKDEPQ